MTKASWRSSSEGDWEDCFAMFFKKKKKSKTRRLKPRAYNFEKEKNKQTPKQNEEHTDYLFYFHTFELHSLKMISNM